MEVKQKKIEKSQLELGFELSAEEFKHFIDHALEHLKKHVKVDGFRPGQAPNKLIEDKIKPESLLMEAGDIAVRETYLNYIKESKLEPVGQPEVSIIKIAQGSPFVFKAIITVLPNVELPDYKEIAIRQLADSKGKEISVTEEEVLDSINYLQKTRAKFTEKNPTSPDGSAGRGDFVEIKYSAKEINGGKEINDKFILGEGGFMAGFEDGIVSMKTGEEKEISVKLNGKDTILKVKIVSLQKMELPEINDELAAGFGQPHPAGGAVKQGMADFCLHFPDCLAQSRLGNAHVLPRKRRCNTAPRGSFQKTDLHKIRFNHFLNSSNIFRKTAGKRFNAYRSAAKFLNYRKKVLPVIFIQTHLVNFKNR